MRTLGDSAILATRTVPRRTRAVPRAITPAIEVRVTSMSVGENGAAIVRPETIPTVRLAAVSLRGRGESLEPPLELEDWRGPCPSAVQRGGFDGSDPPVLAHAIEI